MALELFKPFILGKLEEKGIVSSIQMAKKLVEKESPEVWDALEEVVQEFPVLLNRAPTLHRLGIQAFEPILIEGKAIRLHPLVCTAFNADFDGDQMAVHIPLSIEAQTEARVLMMSSNNILSPAHGDPIIVPTQDIVLGLYYMTRERPFAPGDNQTFYSPEEVRRAYDAGAVSLHARISVRMNGEFVQTTVGRVLLSEILPRELNFELVNKVMTKKAIAKLVDECYRKVGRKATVILADRLKDLGYAMATQSGISISIKDMVIPSKKPEILRKAFEEVKEIERQYSEGLITEGEKYNKVVDTWAKATEDVAAEMMKEIATEIVVGPDGKKEQMQSFNPIYMMADSGARGSKEQMRQLAGMRGLMAKPSGEIIETPITANFREGLTVLQYFISTHGARKGLADTALKTANSGYLTRRLVDVSQDMVVLEEDCGTLDGIEQTALLEAGEIIQQLSERILGRIAHEDIVDPVTGEVLVHAGEEIDEEAVKKIEEAGIERVPIRSPLTCKSTRGVCVKCYGRDLAQGKLVGIGEAVGIIAAQSIGEPGTQLTMRTFHIGGAVSKRVEQTSISNRYAGIVKFVSLHTVVNRNGELIAINRNGELVIESVTTGRERERYRIIYGAKVKVKDGDLVEPGTSIAEWDPFNTPILTEVAGTVKFGDLIEGHTLQEKIDPVTGKASKFVSEYKETDLRPRISIKDAKNRTIARYYLPVGAILMVNEGDEVYPGDVLAKIPRETTKTKDITGGLPRVAELFEVRRPKEHAIIAEIDGTVHFGRDTKGKRKIIIEPEVGEPREYLIPKGKHIIVHEGDYVRAGEPLMDGAPDPHDILRVLGEKAIAKYLLDEVQRVYRLQGVRINDKHIEIIIRQMIKRVKITNPGDSGFMPGEQVERHIFEQINEQLIAQGKTPAYAEPLLLGITKASLSTDSFISAASFQETTKVLTDAASAGKIDRLKGLKENVILGRLIPAGTGLPRYRAIRERAMVR